MNSGIIKVCGMRDADNIRAVEQLGIDWMGFIFYERSGRYVSERPAYLPTSVKRVGVFVDAAIDTVGAKIAEYALDFVQLHGNESADYIRRLRSTYCPSVGVIKAISIETAADLRRHELYDGTVDFFLFDTRCTTVGGSGRHFDWSVLDGYDGSVPFLLSGGIGPDDAGHISTFRHPKLAGIDLNSRFESSPALKDIIKLKQFIHDYQQHQ